MVEAKVICDSISLEGIRITTFQLRYPRMVHADFMTHRVFSRNGRSSRAVPVVTLLKEDPYLPHFMKNKPGMQATEELNPVELALANQIWLNLARDTKEAVRQLNEIGVHKQWANRPLEWFGYIDVLVTSTDWANFFTLRDHSDAQPEIEDLAALMKVRMDESTPRTLRPGEWHLPYILPEEVGVYTIPTLQKLSVARSARLSYAPFDGNAALEKELDRYEKLVVSQPVHASPAEHQATPDKRDYAYHDSGVGGVEYKEDRGWENEKLHGNFFGWIQYRKTIPNEAVKENHR